MHIKYTNIPNYTQSNNEIILLQPAGCLYTP